MTEYRPVAVLTPSPAWQQAIDDLPQRVTMAVRGAVAASNRVHRQSEVSVVLSDDRALQILNKQHRGKDEPTNVLSFPGDDLDTVADAVAGLGRPLILGDVVIAFETVRDEAAEQGKALADHLAHILVHGVLHLCGFDHERPEDAEVMESLEREVLHEFGIADPYAAPKPQPKSGRAARPPAKRNAVAELAAANGKAR